MITILLIFYGGTELMIYLIADHYGYDVLQLECIKCMLIALVHFLLYSQMENKEWEKDAIYRMNYAVSAVLSSVSGAAYMVYFLKLRGTGMSWIVFLIAYVVTCILFYWMWTKSKVTKEESESGSGNALLGVGGGLLVITLGRIAAQKELANFIVILSIIWIWVCLFVSLLLFVMCKYDFDKMSENAEDEGM